MPRIRLIMLAALAVFALSADASASASAMCYRVAVAGSGAWENNACTVAGGTKEWVKVSKLETEIPGHPGEWCAKVEPGEPSRFSDNKCTIAKVGTGEFIKVIPECPDVPTGGDVALCKGGVEQEGTFPFTSKKKAATASKLEVTGGPTIVCQKAANVGQFNAADSNLTVSKLVIKFTECEITNTAETKANCEVEEPISTKEITGGFTGSDATKINFSPAVGTEFATVTIKNKAGKACIFKNTGSKVTGKQTCNVLSPSTEAVTHELECLPAGSTLEFAGKEAKFTLTEEVTLNAGGNWSLQES